MCQSEERESTQSARQSPSVQPNGQKAPPKRPWRSSLVGPSDDERAEQDAEEASVQDPDQIPDADDDYRRNHHGRHP